jgi:hypothetical protein
MMLYNNIEHKNKLFKSSSDTITQICVINGSTAFYTGSSVLDSILVYHHLNLYEESSSFDRASDPLQNIKTEPALSFREGKNVCPISQQMKRLRFTISYRLEEKKKAELLASRISPIEFPLPTASQLAERRQSHNYHSRRKSLHHPLTPAL